MRVIHFSLLIYKCTSKEIEKREKINRVGFLQGFWDSLSPARFLLVLDLNYYNL